MWLDHDPYPISPIPVKPPMKYKNNGTEEILCWRCGKGFPHGAVAVKSAKGFRHATVENPKNKLCK